MQAIKNFYHNKPVLVTGGAGFIGSHITEQLVNIGARVTVLDNLSTGKLTNLDAVIDKITFITGDITDYQTCLQATHNQSIVFHGAAVVSVPESVAQPILCHEINTQGVNTLLEAARSNIVNRVLFSSSSAVYGAQNSTCSEETLCAPTSPYGFSKLMGELYCQQYAQVYGLKTLCLRYFNVYGPRQNAQGAHAGVVAKLRQHMANNQPITLFGDGLQTRDFSPVGDIAAANITLGALPPEYFTGQAINIARGTSITLLELIEQLRKEFVDYNQPITFSNPRTGDILHSAADCTKLHKTLQTNNFML